MKFVYYYRNQVAGTWLGPFQTYGQVVRDSISKGVPIYEVETRAESQKPLTETQEKELKR